MIHPALGASANFESKERFLNSYVAAMGIQFHRFQTCFNAPERSCQSDITMAPCLWGPRQYIILS